MTDNSTPNKNTELAIQTGSAIGSTAANLALTSVPVTAAGISGFLAFIPTAVMLCSTLFMNRKQKRFENWWKRVTSYDGALPKDRIEEEIRANVEEPWVHETIMQSAQKLLESMDDAVAPVIGALTAEYLQEKKQPDRFFRGFCRVLTDLSAEELVGLQNICAAVLKSKSSDWVTVKIVKVEQGQYRVGVKFENSSGIDKFDWIENTVPSVHLFHLLKIHGLGHETDGSLSSIQLDRTNSGRILKQISAELYNSIPTREEEFPINGFVLKKIWDQFVKSGLGHVDSRELWQELKGLGVVKNEDEVIEALRQLDGQKLLRGSLTGNHYHATENCIRILAKHNHPTLEQTMLIRLQEGKGYKLRDLQEELKISRYVLSEVAKILNEKLDFTYFILNDGYNDEALPRDSWPREPK